MTASFRVTTTDLTVLDELEIELHLTTSVVIRTISDDLINLRLSSAGPLTGTQIGTDCGNGQVRFREGAPDFATATPPYAGTFKPFGAVPPTTGTGNFDRYEGQPARFSSWKLTFRNLDAPVTLECFTLELQLQRRPGTIREEQQP